LAAFICLKNSPDLKLANETLLLLARKLGINCGPYACDFSQEALADMFSEQAVLCSTLPYVAKSAFEILLSKGIPKELAFYECFYEMKLIIDTLLKVGPEAFFQMISPNAFIGGERASKILFDDHFHVALNKLWDDLENGKCLRDMDQEMNHLSDLRAAVGRKWEGPILNEFKRFREAGHVEVKHQLKQALDHQGPAPL
jgi:ketol-acid reductoisomerase